MTVAANALCTLANALSYMGLDADDLPASGIAVYHDGTGSVTTATVTVTDLTMVLVATGAATITTTYTFANAADDTLGEIVTAINALAGTESAGWTARLLGASAQASGDLIPVASTSALLQANEQTLNYQDVTLIESLIDAVSDAIEKYCGRNFASATYREWLQGDSNELLLRNPPVTAIRRLATGRASALEVEDVSTSDLRATVEVQDNQMVLTRIDSVGAVAASTLTFASNLTASLLVTAINAIGANWSATLRTNCISEDFHRMGGQDALRRRVDITYPDVADFEYRVEEDSGLIALTGGTWSAWLSGGPDSYGEFSNGWRDVLVEYTGGYSTIPDDLEQIAIELVSEAYNGRGKDFSVQSESIGSYSYVNRILQAPEGHSFRDRLALWRRYTP